MCVCMRVCVCVFLSVCYLVLFHLQSVNVLHRIATKFYSSNDIQFSTGVRCVLGVHIILELILMIARGDTVW